MTITVGTLKRCDPHHLRRLAYYLGLRVHFVRDCDLPLWLSLELQSLNYWPQQRGPA